MKSLRLFALMVVLVLVAAACGDSAEEQILEQILESGNDGISDLDINTDDGEFNISIEGEDGEDINIVSQGEDGSFNMTVEGEDGETFTIGGGEVPDDLQTPVADGGNVTSTFSSNTDRSVGIEYPENRFDELVSMYDGIFSGDSVSRSESSYSTDEGTIRSVNWWDSDSNANVTVSDCYSISSGQLTSVCVNIFETTS